MAFSYAEDVETPPARVVKPIATALPNVKPNTTRPGVGVPVPLPPSRPTPPPVPPPASAPTGTSQFERTCKGAICRPFYHAFKACEPQCEPTNFGAHRPSPGSCHSQSRAFDLMGMSCKVNGKSKNFTAYDQRYFKMVACVKSRHKKTVPHIIWQVEDHMDHAHFSVGCNIGGSYRW